MQSSTTSTNTEMPGNARRRALGWLGRSIIVCLTGTYGWLRTLSAYAAEWPKVAFEEKALDDALKDLGLNGAIESNELTIKAPEIAENGAQVPVEMISKLPNTESIHLFVDKNPQPYTASFSFLKGVDPSISTRIKMGETSALRAVAKADGKLYMATREVKVTIGGCGE